MKQGNSRSEENARKIGYLVLLIALPPICLAMIWLFYAALPAAQWLWAPRARDFLDDHILLYLLQSVLPLLIVIGSIVWVLLVLLRSRASLYWLPVCAAMIAFVTGVIASAGTLTDETGFTHLYHAIQLFAGQGGWTTEALKAVEKHSLGVGWIPVIHLARLMAVAATLSVVLALFRTIHEALMRVFAALEGHTVLCGLGEVGNEFVTQWHAETPKGYWRRLLDTRMGRLIVVEQDRSNPNIETALNKGVAVLQKDAFDPDVLARKARVHKANTVIGLLEDDTRNIELAVTVRQVCEQTRRRSGRMGLLERWRSKTRSDHASQQRESARKALKQPATRLLVHVDDTRLARRAQDHSRLGPERCTQTRFFNFYEETMRNLLRDHPPDRYADLLDADKVHLAIYGFGEMGEALLAHAVRLCHFYPEHATLHITICDARAGDAAFAEGFWRNRQGLRALEPNVHIALQPLPDARHGISAATLQELGSAAQQPPTQHFVCFDSDALSARFALALRDGLRDMEPFRGTPESRRALAWNAPIFVRLRQRQGLANLFLPLDSARDHQGEQHKQTAPDSLFAFGMIEDVVKPSALIDEWRDGLAQAFHDKGYRATRQQARDDLKNVWRKETDVSWPELNLFHKRSNRAQADHVRFKLRAVRCTLFDPAKDARPGASARGSGEQTESRHPVHNGPYRLHVSNDGEHVFALASHAASDASEADPADHYAVTSARDGNRFTEPSFTALSELTQGGGKSGSEKHRVSYGLKDDLIYLDRKRPGLRPSAAKPNEHDGTVEIIRPLGGHQRRLPAEAPFPGCGSSASREKEVPNVHLAACDDRMLACTHDKAKQPSAPKAWLRGGTAGDAPAWAGEAITPFESDVTVVCTALAHDGSRWVAVGSDGGVAYGDLSADGAVLEPEKAVPPNPETPFHPEQPTPLQVTSVAISARQDDKPPMIAVACGEGELWIWDGRADRWRQRLTPTIALPRPGGGEWKTQFLDRFQALGFSPDGGFIAGATETGLIRVAPSADESARADASGSAGEWIVADAWLQRLMDPAEDATAANEQAGAPPSESTLERLARLEHTRWNAYHFENGWRYGSPRVDPARIHDNLVDWEKVPQNLRRFDRNAVAKLPAYVSAVDDPSAVRREYYIGLIGQPSDPQAVQQAVDRIADQLKQQLAHEQLPKQLTLVSTLEHEGQRALADALLRQLDMRLAVLLPLPFEQYYQTFGDDEAAAPADRAEALAKAVEEFTALVGQAQYHVEMPMRFGPMPALAAGNEPRGDPGSPRRKQYQLTNAYIAQHCDLLLVGDDPQHAGTTSEPPPSGSVREAREWWQGDRPIPEAFRWRNRYHQPPTKPVDDAPIYFNATGPNTDS